VSTDLRRALRDAVADEPTFVVDPRVLAHTGTHRLRRRNALTVGAAAIATAAVLVATSLVSRPSTSNPDPAPAERTVRLDLDDAVAVRPDVVASARTTWRDAGRNSLEYDRLLGITADGMVLRSRYTNAHGRVELGLLDPTSGATDWLPGPPWTAGDVAGVELDADRLVVIVRTGIFQYTTAVFDRASRTWQASEARLPGATEGHIPPRALVGHDDRLYLGSTMEGEEGPLHWWSAPLLGDAGDARPEPDLEGAGVAWGDDGSRLVADPDGRVVLSSGGDDRILSERRPDRCERPSTSPDAPVVALAAGARAVVTYICGTDEPDVFEALTIVYGHDVSPALRLEGATALASDERHLFVVGGSTLGYPLATTYVETTSTYLVDLEQRTINRVGRGVQESQVDLAAGMLLWNSPGRLSDRSTYDVTWQVARIG
jgi:hypothetical protein